MFCGLHYVESSICRDVLATSTLVSCLAYSSILELEATCSSETSVDFQLTKRRYTPGDRTLHDYRCENLKSYILCGIVNSVKDMFVGWNSSVWATVATGVLIVFIFKLTLERPQASIYIKIWKKSGNQKPDFWLLALLRL
jgi:hypothetical protein